MFGLNYFSQRNSSFQSQSCYEGSHNQNLFESYNLLQCNPYPISNTNLSNPQPNSSSQNPLNFSQFSNKNNSMIGKISTQQSFTNSNFINYKQFEKVFIEGIKRFPNQVNDYLTKEEENKNLKLLLDSVNNASLNTFQHINKINETYCSKLSNSNCCVPKLFELCSKINELLNSIDNELLNQFSLLTSFHGYDESVQNEEKQNLNRIQNVINECNELLIEKITKINNSSMDYNNEINSNCTQFKNILDEEMKRLNQNLNELIIYNHEKNKNFSEYQLITNNIINTINSLKNKFIYLNKDSKNDDSIIVEKGDTDKGYNEKSNGELKMDNNKQRNIDEESNYLNKMATLKIINSLRNKKRKKNKKY